MYIRTVLVLAVFWGGMILASSNPDVSIKSRFCASSIGAPLCPKKDRTKQKFSLWGRKKDSGRGEEKTNRAGKAKS